ncbi:MAG: hypothetical protein AAGD43_18670 [Pseudomonadota bacterium]
MTAALAAGETANLGSAKVRAEVLRAIAFGRGSLCRLTDFGIRLNDVEIVGCLDLDGCAFDRPIVLTRVSIACGQPTEHTPALSLCDANLRQLRLHSSRVCGAIAARRAIIDNGMVIDECAVEGALALSGTRIGHTLSLRSSAVGDGQSAIDASELMVDGSLTLQDGQFRGTLDLSRCQITSSMNAQAAVIDMSAAPTRQSARDPEALIMDSASVAGDVLLSSAHLGGSVHLENAKVGGRIEAIGCVVNAPTGQINLSGIDVQKSLCFDDADIRGVLRLVGARIGKLLLANRINLDGGETAIEADLINIGGNWEMTGGKLIGQLRCPGARIDGQLRLSDTKIFGSELALRADGIVVRGGYFASRSLMVGLVRFPGAHFGNQFRLRKATIKVDFGAALLASGAQFDRNLELGSSFETIGAVVLDQARITGVCDLDASRIRSAAVARLNSTQPAPVRPAGTQAEDERFDEAALSFVDAKIGRLQMPKRGEDRPRGIVNLSRAHIGALEDWSASWPPKLKRRFTTSEGRDIDHLVLDGLVYDHLVNPAGLSSETHSREEDRAGTRRMIWLDGQSRFDVAEHIRPQPWVCLASRLTEQGLSSEAEKVTIERRRRERLSHASTRLGRLENRLLDWTALFGFSPLRTVSWSLLVILVFAGVWGWAAGKCEQPGCFDQKVFVTSNRDAYASEQFERLYPAFNSVAYSVDAFLPFVNLGQGDHWRPNESFAPIATLRVPNLPAFLTGATKKNEIMSRVSITTGHMLYWLGLLQGLIGITLISLLITSFTGLLRDAR